MPTNAIQPIGDATIFNTGSHMHQGDSVSSVVYDYSPFGADFPSEFQSVVFPPPSGNDVNIVPSGDPMLSQTPPEPVSDNQTPQV